MNSQNSTIMVTAEDYKNTLVVFHIGRGGRFNNGGYYTFLDDVEDFGDLISQRQQYLFPHDEDENGNPLPQNEQYYTDEAGNIMLNGCEIDSKTGILDWDGDYDTDLVCKLCDCTSNAEQALLRAYKNGDISKYDSRYEIIKSYLIDAMLLDEEDEEED